MEKKRTEQEILRLDTLCRNDKELYSLKYQELCQLAYNDLSLHIKKVLETRATKSGYSDPKEAIN